MRDGAFKVGVIGCGEISKQYFLHCPIFDILKVVACSSLHMDSARDMAKKHGVPKACTVDDLLADPEIDIVINLTVPQAHAEVSMAILNAGKHLFVEKPLAVTRQDARQMLNKAAENDLRIGCAPDTFLGGGIQTCRKLIDDGVIGEPVAATAFMMWRNDLTVNSKNMSQCQPGAGPMMGMGVYYLTALINLLGPIRNIAALTKTIFPERTIVGGPNAGKKAKVAIPTYLTGSIEFVNGALGTMITSCDVWADGFPNIEIYGTKGTLRVPDPNTFGGPVLHYHGQNEKWEELPLTHAYATPFRGLGVADLAYGIRSGRQHRASGELAYHVLDAMLAFEDSAREGKRIELQSRCTQPAALPLGLVEGNLDD